ncbi:hypothetical protein J0X19_13860 [Hymenobacter sp. BT186]|uniref:Uncharacterized protein n=1 Tax=Hymenobacter telluris TaxID=2816474 RepID=A0A939EWZ7_9BACT|nr:hypothetical protein [Hymenobacter telluris]MBO0359040.1 hypothetical protein [Hymenobacter telluris]MBW3375066.1 hypothetical protein [Hymenobacter norwichensis]
MKFTRLYAALLALPLSASLGCDKDTDEPLKPCERGNYSITIIKFGNTAVRHSIRIVYSTTRIEEKTVAAGKGADTVNVSAGTYPLSISSISGSNQVLETVNRTVVAERCNEQTISVPF